MSVGFALLGLLAEGPAHGYDLKRDYDARFPAAKPLAYGQVYATLTRLERDGLVEVAETRQQGGPERTVYALTDAGESGLHGWLAESEPAGPYPADDLVRKTVTALHLGADAGDFLRRQRSTHLDMMRDLVSLRRDLRDPSARISVDHTIYHLDADLRWLETAAGRASVADLGGDQPPSGSSTGSRAESTRRGRR
jgi:DNA-binding PadR family transcriptional regulator